MSLTEEIQQSEFADEHHEAVLNVHFTSHFLYRLIQEGLREFEISNEQYNILRILRGNPGPPYCLSDVRARMLNKTANATRLVEKLRRRGLVSRELNEQDRRRVDLRITDEGLDLLNELDRPVNQVHERVVAALSVEDATKLAELLARLRRGITDGGR